MNNKYSASIFLLFFLKLNLAFSNSVQTYYQTRYSDQTQLAFVGDILLHRPLVVQSKKKGFIFLWKNALPYLKIADINVANLEGPIAANVNRQGKIALGKNPWNPPISTSYPRFNYPPPLATALRKSGFTITTTANNHAFDRFSIGVNKTIDTLRENHIIALGSKKPRSNTPWYRITQKKGLSIAWIACTDSLNGLKDKYHQVLRCDQRWGKKTILSLIHQLRHQVNAIIVLPHWGTEYQKRPNRWQQHFAKQVLNAGASMVIGTHPHVLQPFKQYRTRDHRLTFIAYSLGNFVSNQGTPTNRASMILLIGLKKLGNKTIISSIRYQPTYMQNRRGLNKIQLQILKKPANNRFAWRFVHKVINKAT